MFVWSFFFFNQDFNHLLMLAVSVWCAAFSVSFQSTHYEHISLKSLIIKILKFYEHELVTTGTERSPRFPVVIICQYHHLFSAPSMSGHHFTDSVHSYTMLSTAPSAIADIFSNLSITSQSMRFWSAPSHHQPQISSSPQHLQHQCLNSTGDRFSCCSGPTAFDHSVSLQSSSAKDTLTVMQ